LETPSTPARVEKGGMGFYRGYLRRGTQSFQTLQGQNIAGSAEKKRGEEFRPTAREGHHSRPRNRTWDELHSGRPQKRSRKGGQQDPEKKGDGGPAKETRCPERELRGGLQEKRSTTL